MTSLRSTQFMQRILCLLSLLCLVLLLSACAQKNDDADYSDILLGWREYNSTTIGLSFVYPENIFFVFESERPKQTRLVDLDFVQNASLATPDSPTIIFDRLTLGTRTFENFTSLIKNNWLNANMNIDSESNVIVSNYSAVHILASRVESLAPGDSSQKKRYVESYIINVNDVELVVISNIVTIANSYDAFYFDKVINSVRFI